MIFSEIVYMIVLFLFVFMTFGIIKNYYKNKFDEKGRRIDMLDEEDKKE